MTNEQISVINAFYLPLEAKQRDIRSAVSELPYRIVVGWYNGHYRKNSCGEWERSAYPIPEVDLMGLCDIEIHFDGICVSTKLLRDKALDCTFDRFSDLQFEAHGVQDFLLDFYWKGITLEAMKRNIRESQETEIGITFYLPFDSDADRIRHLLLSLRDEGFYY